MTEKILNTVIKLLRQQGAPAVYRDFDAVPIEKKGRGIFITAGISSLETAPPVVSALIICVPVRAEVEICIIAPEETPMKDLYACYDKYVARAFTEERGTFRSMTAKYDPNLRRMVLTAKLLLRGYVREERGTQ